MGLLGDNSKSFDYAEDAVIGVATKNAVTDIDFKITKPDMNLNGGNILYRGAVWGDHIRAVVVDKDGAYYPAGTVLKTYIYKRYLHPTIESSEIALPYVGYIPPNLYLRITFTSTGTVNDVDVAVNYYLHTDE